MPRFYVTMTWDNWPEGGSYGTVLETDSHDDAEEHCRQEMAATRADKDDYDEHGSVDAAEAYIRKCFEHEWQTVDCFDLDQFIANHSKATA